MVVVIYRFLWARWSKRQRQDRVLQLGFTPQSSWNRFVAWGYVSFAWVHSFYLRVHYFFMLNSLICKTQFLAFFFKKESSLLWGLFAPSEFVSGGCFSFPCLPVFPKTKIDGWKYHSLIILAQAFTGPYSEPNVIIYFERLRADCYAVSLLKRHTTLPESHVAGNQG